MKQSSKRKVIGKFPGFCYRVYDCEEHAAQFINNGKFRLGCLGRYRNLEDQKRCDRTEGFGHTSEPGEITVAWVSTNPNEKTIWTREKGYQEHHFEYGNKIYCFCTYLPEVSFQHMLEIGKYIVKINNPQQFAEDINRYLANLGKRFLVQGCRVTYNKGEKLKKPLTDNERLDLAYQQKPKVFISDREFRIVAMDLAEHCPDECKFLSGQFEQIEPECQFLEVNLSKTLSYLSLVNSVNKSQE